MVVKPTRARTVCGYEHAYEEAPRQETRQPARRQGQAHGLIDWKRTRENHH